MSRRESLLRLWLPAEAVESLMGDLNEELRNSILPRYGRGIGWLWSWLHVLTILWQFAMERFWQSGAMLWLELFHAIGHDVRFAFRTFRRQAMLTGAIVVTLAVGIGATAAIFSVAQSTVLRPLPFREPDRLVHIFETGERDPQESNFLLVRPGNYHDWKSKNDVFASMTGFASRRVTLSGGSSAEIVWGHRVIADFFETTGVSAVIGRTFQRDDYQDSSRRVVILSDRLWRRRFASDRSILDREIVLDTAAYRVIGVMPPEFYPTAYSTPELWTPLVLDRGLELSRVDWLLTVIARLKPGTTIAQAQTDLARIAKQINQQYADGGRDMTVAVKSLPEFVLGRYESLFLLLLAAVGLLLLAATVNVASLTMARVLGRTSESVVRSALGASRIRLARQSVIESLMLALFGGVAGLLLAYWGVQPVRALLPASSRVPRIDEIQLDLNVCLVGIGLSVVVGFLLSVIPSLRGGASDLYGGIRAQSRGSTRTASRFGNALVIAEVAVSMTLLIGAGLVIRSLTLLERVNLGFRKDHVLTLRLRVPQAKYSTEADAAALLRRIETMANDLPGVETAALTAQVPFEQPYNPWSFVRPGQQFSDPSLEQRAHIQRVSPEYFDALHLPLLSGRFLEPSDSAATRNAVVINQAMARNYWGDANPVGSPITVSLTNQEHSFTVVGVVGDARLKGADLSPYPEMFWPISRFPVPDLYLLIRTGPDPLNVAPIIQAELNHLDPEVAVSDVRTLDGVLSESLWRQRLSTLLLSLFAAVTLVIAMAGLYGILSRSVNQRAQEFGVRTAIGATPADILCLIFRQGIRLVASGLFAGLLLTIAFSRFLSSQLFGVSALDPWVVGGTALSLFAVSAAACCVPAFRAARLSPVRAMQGY